MAREKRVGTPQRFHGVHVRKSVALAVLFLLFGSTLTTHAQQWTHYTNGNPINCIVQEGNNIWVGTDGGLVLQSVATGQSQFFNKANSGLGYNIVNAVAVDRNGRKWIATGAGLFTYDGTTWKKFSAADGLSEYNMACIAVEHAASSDTIWIGYYGGLAKYDGKNFTLYTTQTGLPDWVITSIVIGSDGTKWMGTSAAGLVRFDGSKFTSYNLSNSGIPYNNVKDVMLDGTTVWVSTDGLGAAKFDGTNWTVYSTQSTSSGLPSNYIRAIRKGSGTAMYFCTLGGLAKLDGGQWTVYHRSPAGLPSDSVSTATFISPGTLFIGTTTAGMCAFTGTAWSARTTSNSLMPSNSVSKIFVDANDVKWIGTDAGVIRISGSSWTLFNTTNSSLPDNHIRYIAADRQGRILFATDGSGVARCNGTVWDVVPNTTVWNHLNAVGTDNKGRTWIGLNSIDGGFGVTDGSSWQWYYPAQTAGGITLPYGAVTSILFEKKSASSDSENVWLGINGGGIIKMDGNNWTLFGATNSKLANVGITSMDFDNGGPSRPGGSLWVSTWGGGLFRFDGTNWTQYPIGLFKDLSVVCVDSRRNKWVGSYGVGVSNDVNDGLVKFDSLSAIVARYNTSTSSMPGNYVTDVREDKSGLKWIGTYGWGLVVLNDKPAATEVRSDRDGSTPLTIQLSQNFPDPFNPSTTISYQLTAGSVVRLRVYDLLGRQIATLVNGYENVGFHTVRWNGQNEQGVAASSGIYFYQLHAGNFVSTKKMVLLR